MFIYLIVLTIAVFIYLIYKLTFWKRQNLTNIVVSHNYRAVSCGQTCAADQQLVQKYGKIVGTYEFLSPVLLIAEPKLINEVLVNSSENFLHRNTCIRTKSPIGSCILFSRKNEWKTMQNVIEKAFSNKNLLELSKHFAKSNYEFIEILNQVSALENVIDFKMFLSMFAMKTYLNCCFGATLELKTKAKLLHYYQQLIDTKQSFKQRLALIAPKVAQFFNINPMNAKLLANINNLVKDIYDNRKVDKCKNCVLFMLADANLEISNGDKSLTQKQIIDNTIMISIMGYKTSMTTVSHLIYNLSINQSIQQKLIKEVDQFIREMSDQYKNNKSEKVNTNVENETTETDDASQETEVHFLQNLNKLQFLDSCIKETLRLYPPVARLSRTATKDTKLGDYYIRKNSQIFIPVYAVHLDPDNYSNPKQFNPDRFLPTNNSQISPGSYLAFGVGPRSCAGISIAFLEMKLCVINILRNFRFAKCSQTKELHYSDDNHLFCTMSANNMFVKIIKRSKGVLD